MAVIAPPGLALLRDLGLPAPCASRYSVTMAVMVACGLACGVTIEGTTALLTFDGWEVLVNDLATTHRDRFGTYVPPFAVGVWRDEKSVGILARGRTLICDQPLVEMLELADARRKLCTHLLSIEVLR